MQVTLGARVVLRRNICIVDGLVSGVVGTVVGCEYPNGHRQAGEQPIGIVILVDNPKVGRQTRGSD